MGHPTVRQVAVVGAPHPKWQERPVAPVVPAPGHEADIADLRWHLVSTFAKWQLPDEIMVVEELSMTGVGNLDKKVLREEFVNFYDDEDSRAT